MMCSPTGLSAMKTPRVQDFDPNAKIPELGSPMDNLPVIQKTNASTTPVRPVHPVPPVKRVMKSRHPFDIYQDQYDSLKQMASEERIQGGVGSMSAMVREAIDKFIMIRRKEKK